MIGSISDVKNLLQMPAKEAVMQAHGIIDCLTELHLLPVLVKVKNFFQNIAAMLILAWEPMLILPKLTVYMKVNR